MMNSKKIFKKMHIILLAFLFFVTPFLLTSCNKKKANLEVFEVGEIVKYRNIQCYDAKNYKGDKTVILEVILNFENTDYNATGNYSSNDYYIISGKNKINPLDLKVGDQVYFDYRIMTESLPAIAKGSYLYLC